MSSGGGRSTQKVAPQLGRLFDQGTVTGFSEHQLLETFITKRDEAAFEAIVSRHGPMVLKVCRQILHNPADVEDAFQATFVVLVRRAASLSRRELLGNWLYGVAYRVASRSRALAANRNSRISSDADVNEVSHPKGESSSVEFDERLRIHEVLNRLPDRYRIPLILCYFEGLTHEEAAEKLGWPLGSVKGRLARARDLMRTRLVRQGVGLSTGALASLECKARAAMIPELLRIKTVRSALAISGESALSLATSSAITVSVASLSQGVIQTMVVSQIRALILPALLGIGIISTGATVVAYQFSDGGEATEKATPRATAAQTDKPASPGQNPKPGPRLPDDRQTQTPQSPADAQQSGQNQGNPDQQQGNVGPGGFGGRGMMGGGFGAPGMMMGGVVNNEQRQARLKYMESRQRQDNAVLATVVAEADKNPKTKEVLKKLDVPISMDFGHETPLEQLLKYIQSATSDSNYSGIPIYVDPKGLEEAEKTLQSPVVIKLEGIPLKATLRLALKQLGLAYCVHDGFLMISSPRGIREELDEARAELGIPEPDDIQLQRGMGGGFNGSGMGVGAGGGMM